MQAKMTNNAYKFTPPSLPSDLATIRITVPDSPIKIPMIDSFLNFWWKNHTPTKSVQIGVRLFMMPVTELSNLVCARAKRKAGKKMPINPEANSLR